MGDLILMLDVRITTSEVVARATTTKRSLKLVFNRMEKESIGELPPYVLATILEQIAQELRESEVVPV